MNWRVSLALLLAVAAASDGYKVLVVAPRLGTSHFLFMSEFVKALLDRGHEVTFITIFSLNHLNLENYTEISINISINADTESSQSKWVEKLSPYAFIMLHQLNILPIEVNEKVLGNANFQKFIKSTEHNFDVILSEDFFSDAYLMLGYKFGVPIVTICTLGHTESIDRQHGLVAPPSFVPHYILPFTDKMSFSERCFSAAVTVYDWFIGRVIYHPIQERLANKYFAHLGPLPSLAELIRNVSLTLVNTHRAIAPPRPSMPNVIPIGGAHIRSPKPLPNDLQRFMDESEHGVIYFSLGSILHTSKMPKNLINTFLKTLERLKHSVLFKFEDESVASEMPPNVLIRKWMPQSAILAHPNVILFISHGGAFGMAESLYNGVPLLLVPFFGDQFRNAHRTVLAGYGKMLHHHELTVETFAKAIADILSDDTFSQNAKHASAVFNDNLVHPMDEAMFWIEHVAKFKGAKHLRSHAVEMSWFTYFMIDAAIVFASVTVGIIAVVCTLSMKRRRSGFEKANGTGNKSKML